jgi:PAS domain S-box-containing protein
MTESDHANPVNPKGSSRGVQGLYLKYFTDPQAPRLDEIGRLAEDLLLRNTELENTIGNLRQVAKQLEAYRDRYVDLYELAPVGYVTLDDEGYVQEINLAGAELLGKDRDEIVGYPMENHVVAKDKAEFVKQMQRCCSEKQVLTLEVGLITGTDRSITAHLRGVPIESLSAEETFCKIAITDITDRKAAEEAIRASEANYRAIFDTANDAIFVHNVDTGAFLDANQKATELYGYTVEEFRGATVGLVSEGNPPYSQEDAVLWVQKAQAGKPQRFDWKCKDKSGRIFWGSVNLKRTVLNGVPRLLAIVRDITERKQAEEALRASEERFRTVADYTYDWEYWRGPDGQFLYVSPSCQRITGYSAAEFMAEPVLLERIVHPDDRQRLAGHLGSEDRMTEAHFDAYRIISRSGEERWIEHICQPVFGVNHAWLGRRASNRDITDRKKAELALKQRIEALEEQCEK